MPPRAKYIFFLTLLLTLITGTLFYFRQTLFPRFFLKDPHISNLNQELVQLSVMYITAAEAEKPQLTDLTTLAEERKEALTILANEDPARFLANTLSEEEVAQIPQELIDQDLIEKTETIEGQLIVTQLENFDTEEVRTDYAIQTSDSGDNIISLEPTAKLDIQDSQIGADITASGVTIGDTLVVETDNVNNISLSSNPANIPVPQVSEERKVLIITFNFLNDKNNPYTNAELERMMFSDEHSTRNYYQDSSYQKLNLVGTAVGPFTIPFNQKEQNCYDYQAWAIAADTLAYTSGVDINEYQYKVYSFPRPDNCWAGAWADIGGKPSRAYLPGLVSAATITHEIGHNLGFYHANFLDCPTSITTNQPIYTSGCISKEYGDPFDVMGNYGSIPYSLNAPHRVQAGWLAPNQIHEVTKSGIYLIDPLNTQSSGLKTIRIPMSSTDQFYYLEYRTQVGYESTTQHSNSPSNSPLGGLQIRAHNNYTTHLLDPNITLSDESARSPRSDYTKSLLLPGSTFQDTSDGLTIKLISLSDTTAEVEVTLQEGVCERRKPSISINPPYQTGKIGDERTYSVTVTNNDSSECSPSLLSAYAFGDGVDTVNQPSFLNESMAPGASGTFDYVGKFDLRSTLGSHRIKAYANTPSHSQEATAEYFLEGGLRSIQINPSNPIYTYPEAPPSHLSALAYDTYGRPIWTNLIYDWGMSSDTGVGTVNPDVNIAEFVPYNSGQGHIVVTAQLGDTLVNTSLPVFVTNKPTPSPSASPVSSPSLSPFPSPSVSHISSPSASPARMLTADLNSDTFIDLADLYILTSNFGNPYNIFDFNLWFKNYVSN